MNVLYCIFYLGHIFKCIYTYEGYSDENIFNYSIIVNDSEIKNWYMTARLRKKAKMTYNTTKAIAGRSTETSASKITNSRLS